MNFSATLAPFDRGTACFLFRHGRLVIRRDGFTPTLAVAAMVVAIEGSTLVENAGKNGAKQAVLTVCLMSGIDPRKVARIVDHSQNEGANVGLCRVV